MKLQTILLTLATFIIVQARKEIIQDNELVETLIPEPFLKGDQADQLAYLFCTRRWFIPIDGKCNLTYEEVLRQAQIPTHIEAISIMLYKRLTNEFCLGAPYHSDCFGGKCTCNEDTSPAECNAWKGVRHERDVNCDKEFAAVGNEDGKRRVAASLTIARQADNRASAPYR